MAVAWKRQGPLPHARKIPAPGRTSSPLRLTPINGSPSHGQFLPQRPIVLMLLKHANGLELQRGRNPWKPGTPGTGGAPKAHHKHTMFLKSSP